MTSTDSSVFDEVLVDHIEMAVVDLGSATRWLTEGYGFTVAAESAGPAATRSVELVRNDIRFVLTEAQVDDHAIAAYIERHGDGVSDIALRVPDAAAAYEEAVRRGARSVAAPSAQDGTVTATIIGFGDVTHTFVQPLGAAAERVLPGHRRVGNEPADAGAGLLTVDHFAVVVEPGRIGDNVEFYERVLDFELIFDDRIVVGDQAVVTKVVQSRSGAVTLTLIEPDSSQASGHIDEFLKDHGGPGVQHIAFTADSITETVGALGARGVAFLDTPDTYYQLLRERVELSRYSVDEVQALNILVDEDHDGQLLQIFTRSVHPRNTIFLEVIERLGSRSFGSGNIKALYEAVELQRGRGESA